MSTPLAPAANPRLPLVDVLRGTALVVMIFYHLMWDLAYLGFFYDITADLRWVVLQRTILGSFLVLAGISLQLGHGGGIRWRAFWRRWAILVAAAGAMSLATWLVFGEAFAFFGILHAIALFSLLGLVFVRAPWWVAALGAVIVVTLGVTLQLPAFNERPLAWIGFWTVPPWTTDLVSVFPWFGAVLAGIALGKLLPWRRWTWAPRDPVTRGLKFLGRWSLVIYLVHQPLMLAVVYPLAQWLQPGAEVAAVTDAANFVGQCRPACGENNPAGYCEAYCGCALEQIEAADLWDAVNTTEPSEALNGVITLCRAMAEK